MFRFGDILISLIIVLAVALGGVMYLTGNSAPTSDAQTAVEQDADEAPAEVVDDMIDDATDIPIVEDAAQAADDASDMTEAAMEDAAEATEDAMEAAADTAADATEDAMDEAADAVEDATDIVDEAAEAAEDAVEDILDDASGAAADAAMDAL